MKREEFYLKPEPCFANEWDEHAHRITIPQLASAIDLIANEATAAAQKLVNNYNVAHQDMEASTESQLSVMAHLQTASRYGSLATSMDYLKKTRTPFMNGSEEVELYIEDVSFDSFVRLTKGQAYSLDALSLSDVWYKNITEITDPSIPKAYIHKVAKGHKWHIPSITPVNHFKAQSVNAILQSIPLGREMMAQSHAMGYAPEHIDLLSYNLWSRDFKNGKGRALGLADPTTIYIEQNITALTAAIKQMHEIGHGIELHETFNFGNFQDKKSRDGFWANFQQFDALHEAHCISFEYAGAAQLLKAGHDPNQVHNSLYGFEPDIVNLITDDPVKFLEVVSQSTEVQKRWEFKDGQKRLSPSLMKRYAKTMRPLEDRWKDLPQPPKSEEEFPLPYWVYADIRPEP